MEPGFQLKCDEELLCRPPIPPEHGTYILVLCATLWHAVRIDRRGLKIVRVEPGVYAYVGSAWGAGGLRARIYRHLGLSRKKRLHWHIDRLLASEYIAPVAVVYAPGCRGERTAAEILSEAYDPIPGFGASDDPVNNTHLYRLADLEDCTPSYPCISRRLANELVTRLNRACNAHGAIVGLRCLQWRRAASRG